MPILPAHPSDHQVLSEITKASKAHWGYSAAQLAEWDEELTITEGHIQENHVFVCWEGNRCAGYYSLLTPEAGSAKLENLFIRPENIGEGIGSRLLEHAVGKARELGCEKIFLHSDPNATGFYLRHGFGITGQIASSIPGRFMPLMEKEVGD
jgi:N-acetylglutamate synthase-like GNAT family acetyltransferase